MASAQVAIHILLGLFEPHQASDFQQYTKAGTGRIVPFSDRRILVRYTNRRKKKFAMRTHPQTRSVPPKFLNMRKL